LRLEQYTDREGNPRTSAEVNASEIHFLGQRVDATAEASDMAEESAQGDEALEKEEASKPTSSRSGKKSGSKRVPAKEAVGIVDDNIPF
jgi:single-stranded DNA-binding protein